MRIPDEHIEEILKLYGMQALRLGSHFRYNKGKEQLTIDVNQFWIAGLYTYSFSCCVSVAHTESGKYGLIIPVPLIPAWQMKLFRFGTTKGVRIHKWHDSVIDAVATINLVPNDFALTFDGDGWDDLWVSLVAFIDGTRTNINLEPNPQDPRTRKLILALVEAAKTISRTAFLPLMSSQLNKLRPPIVLVKSKGLL